MKNFNAQETTNTNAQAKARTRRIAVKGRSLISAVLTAALMVSATAPMMLNAAPINACAADLSVVGELSEYDVNDPLQKLIFKQVKAQGAKLIDLGLSSMLKSVPFGNEIKDLIKDQLLAVLGLEEEKPVTTNELSEKLDKLDEKIEQAFDEQTKKLIEAMAESFTTGTYKNDMKHLADSADVAFLIQGSETTNTRYQLSEEDKMVKLAMVVGNSSEWSRDGSFVLEYTRVTNDMLGSNYLSNKDIFTVLYNSEKDKYMFSGEALDAIEPYIQKMIFDYMRYTTIALASLDAQEALLSDDFDPSKITDKQLRRQYEDLTNSLSTIEDAKIKFAQNVFGSEAFLDNGISVKTNSKNYDNILAHYESFKQMNRLIHIPTGKVLNPLLNEESADRLIDGNLDKTEQFGIGCRESTTKKEFEERITGKMKNSYNHNCFDVGQMTKLFNHIEKKITEGKFTSVVDYLRKMGFVISDDWDTDDWRYVYRIATGGGYTEKNYSVSMNDTQFKSYIDSVNLHTGKIESVKWREVVNNTGLFDLQFGDRVTCEGTFLMFHEASDPTKQEVRDKAQYEEIKEAMVKELVNAMLADSDFYFGHYNDFIRNDRNALVNHYITGGLAMGRQFCKGFDPVYYLENNADVKEKCGDDYKAAFDHFINTGVFEGRKASAYYDDKFYAEAFSDMASLTPYERFLHYVKEDYKNPERYASPLGMQEYENSAAAL